MNPGLIKSSIRSATLGEGTLGLKLTEWIIGELFPSLEEYTKIILPLLFSPGIESHSGAMFNRHGDPIQPSKTLASGLCLLQVLDQSERLASGVLS